MHRGPGIRKKKGWAGGHSALAEYLIKWIGRWKKTENGLCQSRVLSQQTRQLVGILRASFDGMRL